MRGGYIILISGMSASGKTRFAEHLSGALNIPLILKDAIKERLWERFHYKPDETQLYGGAAYDIAFLFFRGIDESKYSVYI